MTASASREPLADFFRWWNAARAAEAPFTAADFARFVTHDAVLNLDGLVIARGPEAWAAYFEAARARGGSVTIVVPALHSFRAGADIYTLHLVEAIRPGGVVSCTINSGYATLRDDRIALLMLVRSKYEPQAT
jgi:hypothetical protein